MAIAASAPGAAGYMQMRSHAGLRDTLGAVDSLLRPRGPYGDRADRAAAARTVRRPYGGRADRAARRHSCARRRSYNCAATWLQQSCPDRAGRRSVVGVSPHGEAAPRLGRLG